MPRTDRALEPGTIPLSITLYERDLDAIAGALAELKARGAPHATRAAVIRVAIRELLKLPTEQIETLLAKL